MPEDKVSENKENIIRIEGELKLINQKLDNHIHHIAMKVDTIFKIVCTVSFMVFGLLIQTVYTILIS